MLKDPPIDFVPVAELAIVLPLIDEKILLLQRVPAHPQANLWCAPGGKIGLGESPMNAAIRELQEETGIIISSPALFFLGKFYIRYPNGDFVFYLFKTQLMINHPLKIKASEHSAYGLYSRTEINDLPLTPGLLDCIEHALKTSGS